MIVKSVFTLGWTKEPDPISNKVWLWM